MTEVVVTQEDVLLVDAISVEMDAYREAWFAPDKERALDHYEKAKQLAARHRTQAQAAGTVLLEATLPYLRLLRSKLNITDELDKLIAAITQKQKAREAWPDFKFRENHCGET